MQRAVYFWFAVAIGGAALPTGANARPPECDVTRDVSSSDPSRRTRRLLRGLIPSVYVEWRGWRTRRWEHGGRGPVDAPPASEQSDARTSRRHSWEIGLRWSPLEMFAAAEKSNSETPERESPRVDPDLCRRLARLRHRISVRAEPDTQTLLEKAILERRLESVRSDD